MLIRYFVRLLPPRINQLIPSETNKTSNFTSVSALSTRREDSRWPNSFFLLFGEILPFRETTSKVEAWYSTWSPHYGLALLYDALEWSQLACHCFESFFHSLIFFFTLLVIQYHYFFHHFCPSVVLAVQVSHCLPIIVLWALFKHS